ncbi:MAG: tetratricopeptide repeat protein [Candidatus Hodarchaeota archaeon]
MAKHRKMRIKCWRFLFLWFISIFLLLIVQYSLSQNTLKESGLLINLFAISLFIITASATSGTILSTLNNHIINICPEKSIFSLLFSYLNEIINFESFISDRERGNYYCELAERREKMKNCKKAIDAYENAISRPNLGEWEVASIKNNLGTSYSLLAEVENTSQNCTKAISLYEEAIKIREGKKPRAVTMNNLGNTYCTLAEFENKILNCNKGIEILKEALQLTKDDPIPILYATIQNNLGVSYRILGEVKNDVNTCRDAIDILKDALEIRRKFDLSQQIAATENNLGVAYYTLAAVENDKKEKISNCIKAIDFFQEALNTRTPDKFPQDYAMTQNNLGNVLCLLAKIGENISDNCSKAYSALLEALNFYNLEEYPINHEKAVKDFFNCFSKDCI